MIFSQIIVQRNTMLLDSFAEPLGVHVNTSLKKEFNYSCITSSCVENKVDWGILYAQLRQFEPGLFGAVHRIPFSVCMASIATVFAADVAIAATACSNKQ
jgi:hypothetical protein